MLFTWTNSHTQKIWPFPFKILHVFGRSHWMLLSYRNNIIMALHDESRNEILHCVHVIIPSAEILAYILASFWQKYDISWLVFHITQQMTNMCNEVWWTSFPSWKGLCRIMAIIFTALTIIVFLSRDWQSYEVKLYIFTSLSCSLV